MSHAPVTRRQDDRDVATPAHLTIGVVPAADLDALRADWEQLHRSSGTTNPFTHPRWMSAWLDAHDPQDPRLVTVRRGQQLLAVAPVHTVRWPARARSLQTWGTGQHTGPLELPAPLAQPDDAREAMRQLLVAYSSLPGWDWAEILLAEGAPWFEPEWLGAGGPTVVARRPRGSVVVDVDATFDTTKLKRNLKESLRRGRNRLERDFPGNWTVSAYPDDQAMLAIADVQRLHRARAALRGRKPHNDSFAAPCEARMFADALADALRAHDARVYRLVVDGEVWAVQTVLRAGTGLYMSLSGMHPRAWDYSPIPLLQYAAIVDGVGAGILTVNFSAGPDQVKLRWSEQVRSEPSFVVVAPRRRSRAAFALYTAAAAVAEVRRERERYRAGDRQ